MKGKGNGTFRSKLSESFVKGVIALVFLMIGYQTAVFMHSAAVLKIAADRDVPDTVVIYAESRVQAQKTVQSVPVRKKAEHTRVVEAVRQKIPPGRIESFRFDPNTVSVEDLCRLGFSRKQSESIDNYRKKGGRFVRKSDFARSYVVSDSVYSRLEPFIDIPLLDLNAADSAALDALPGIGGWFAARIIAHRAALGGYSCKEQLMDVWRFDRERYEGLCDLVTVDSASVVPYPLWSLPADSLRRHPYIRRYETARAIVVFRENTPKDEWSVHALADMGIISAEDAVKLSRCRIAHP